MPYQTINEVIARLPAPTGIAQLPAPRYTPTPIAFPSKVALAVESMKRHMTDEGWQIMEALRGSGYQLHGHNIGPGLTNVPSIIRATNPSTVVVQDKREWDLVAKDFRDPYAKFNNVQALRERPDIFKLTILKDSHQRPDYHRNSADEMGCNAWIVYYHPRIVSHLAPYVRPEHLVRTYHTIDPTLVPPYSPNDRNGALLSGAVSNAYPLRSTLVRGIAYLPQTDLLPHPGYHRAGCCTPEFFNILSRYRVAICTCSRYGYALRKIIEATAAGCIVLTDLPCDEVLPEIDGNLVRITPDFSPRRVGGILRELYDSYNPQKQEHYAKRAQTWYNYAIAGRRLVNDIETLRSTYGRPTT